MSKRSSRSHTKAGPGRYHGSGVMFVHPMTDERGRPKQPGRRSPVAIHGGNWKGKEYLSYREHDLARRRNLLLSEIKALRAA